MDWLEIVSEVVADEKGGVEGLILERKKEVRGVRLFLIGTFMLNV